MSKAGSFQIGVLDRSSHELIGFGQTEDEFCAELRHFA
jgi:hypothetical protein